MFGHWSNELIKVSESLPLGFTLPNNMSLIDSDVPSPPRYASRIAFDSFLNGIEITEPFWRTTQIFLLTLKISLKRVIWLRGKSIEVLSIPSHSWLSLKPKNKTTFSEFFAISIASINKLLLVSSIFWSKPRANFTFIPLFFKSSIEFVTLYGVTAELPPPL